ncbi:MAG: EAL domain-containing protein [Nodosilinea sp.]
MASEDSIILSLPTVGQGEVNLLVHPLILTTEWGLLRPPDLGPDGFLAYVNTANGEILASSGEVPSYEILQQSATAGQIRVAQASQNGDVLVIGEVPSSWALRNWKHELLLMVPITILSSGALMALALRLLQRSQGLDHDLSIGFKNEELVIHYQPINDLQTGDCVGCEALLRWYHPEQGVLPPGLFIPIAEKTGLINEIGEWLIKKIVMEKASLYERFPKLYTSINVSPNQLSSGSLDRIISWLLETDLCRPDRFVFEVTETIQVLKSGTNTSDTLARLRTLGARIALDDFGQGYSSLSYLHQFDIDQLKIDRFYVDSIHKDNQVTEIMETIIELGHRLGFTFVAEGIETEEQHQFLRDRGVQYGQGWLFSRPLPIRELEQYFIEHRPPEET